jgi:hypothetical protein
MAPAARAGCALTDARVAMRAMHAEMKDRRGHQQQHLDLKGAVSAHFRGPSRKEQCAGQEADREPEEDSTTRR